MLECAFVPPQFKGATMRVSKCRHIPKNLGSLCGLGDLGDKFANYLQLEFLVAVTASVSKCRHIPKNLGGLCGLGGLGEKSANGAKP
jgi:hypothetical protein